MFIKEIYFLGKKDIKLKKKIKLDKLLFYFKKSETFESQAHY